MKKHQVATTKRPVVALAILVLAVAIITIPGEAHGGVLTERPCTRGVEPAATLLVPYFEVDLRSANGLTTLFAVTNAEAEAALARVVVWSDWALPVVSFPIYLTGFDVQTINMRDLLRGVFPATGSASSPQGNRSSDNQIFPGCNENDVVGSPPDTAFIRAALSGEEIDGACWSSPPEFPGQAKGYVTIDVVNSCTALLPADEGYFEVGGTGIASNRNTLFGDYFFVNPQENFAQGEAAVHLVADADFFSPGDTTFYAPYIGSDASDARIPLASLYATRFLEGGAFSGGTDLLVWRAVGDAALASPGACGSGSRPWLSTFDSKILFDEEENAAVLDTPIPTPLFPLASQRVSLAGRFPWAAGWLQIELFNQGWVTSVLSAEERYSIGYSATRLNDLCSKSE